MDSLASVPYMCSLSSVASHHPLVGQYTVLRRWWAKVTPLATSSVAAIVVSSRMRLRIPFHLSLVGRRNNGVRPSPRNATGGIIDCRCEWRIPQEVTFLNAPFTHSGE